MIPTGFGRFFAIIAVLGLIGYIAIGSSTLGTLGFAALLGVGLHWFFSGGWGAGSYVSRSAGLPRSQATISGQRGSAAQWVWYTLGFIFILATLFGLAVVSFSECGGPELSSP